jgi:oligopeptide/dipeptide ABC transporter ATP-binding protein
MYGGLVVESGSVKDVLLAPTHPYTSGLVSSVPEVSRADSAPHGIPGHAETIPEPLTGCPFYPRCHLRIDSCRRELPALEVPSPADDRGPRQAAERLVRCPPVVHAEGERS